MNRQVVGALVFAVLGLGCSDTDLAPIDVPPGNAEVYSAEVQRYVGLGCGSLDCHGDRGRALRIYAKHGLRLRDALRSQDPSEEEVAANVRAFAGLRTNSGAGKNIAENHIGLLKPLASNAGGMGHVGGDVWADTTTPGYRCLLAFLAERTDPTACADALAEIDVEDDDLSSNATF